MDFCPKCNAKLHFGENQVKHFFSKILGGIKRYCKKCNRRWSSKKSRRRQRTNMTTFALIILVAIILPQLLVNMTSVGANSSSVNTNGKTQLYKVGLNLVQNNPALLAKLNAVQNMSPEARKSFVKKEAQQTLPKLSHDEKKLIKKAFRSANF